MKKVIVTGAGGFIGSSLARKLHSEGHQVIALDVNLDRLKDLEVEKIEMDLCENANWEKAFQDLDGDISGIFHLAALVGVGKTQESPYEVLSKNLLSTLNVFELARTHNARRLVFASTSEIYARAVDAGLTRVPTPEDTPIYFPEVTEGRMSYAISKLVGEALCSYSDFKVPATVIRFHNIYGPDMGMKHVIPQVVKRILEAKDEIEIFNPEHSRSFCYIDDAVEALLAVWKEPRCEGQTIHIGNAKEEVKIEELYTLMMKLLNKKLKLKSIHDVHGSVKRRCPEVGRLKELTGFEAKVTLEEGLSRAVDFYRGAFQ